MKKEADLLGSLKQENSLKVGPLEVLRIDKAEALRLLRDRLEQRKPTMLAFANTNLVNCAHREPAVREALRDFVILNDGIGLEIGARLCNGGRGFVDNLNGTDFTPCLLAGMGRPIRVFLFGALPEAVQKAAEVFGAIENVTIVGTQSGYDVPSDEQLVAKINASEADILLVALGNPRQETWIAANRTALSPVICVGVGALFDFAAGLFRRSPLWVQRLRLEWLFRLAQEPRRLARRYTLDIGYFLGVILWWRYAK